MCYAFFFYNLFQRRRMMMEDSARLHFLGYLRSDQLPLTQKAEKFAHSWYCERRREDGTPYKMHAIESARYLFHQNIENDIVLAALILHDVAEMECVSISDVAEIFGTEVAELVDLQTRREGEAFKDYIKRVSSRIETIISKGADRLHNLSSMINVYSLQRMENYIKETEGYILPMLYEATFIYNDYANILFSTINNISNMIGVLKAYIGKCHEIEEINAVV